MISRCAFAGSPEHHARLEVYLVTPLDTAPEVPITELHLPLK